MSDNLGEIYKITNLVNNKIYVGKTKKYYKSSLFGYLKRFDNHINSAYSKSKFNDRPRLAIRKYGKDKFKVELICEVPLKEINTMEIDTMEIAYINKLNSTDNKIGYNIVLGGG